jgi:hypothetical protein
VRTDPDKIIATFRNVGKTTASANIGGLFYGAEHLIRDIEQGWLGEIPPMRPAEMIIRPVKPFTRDEMHSIHAHEYPFGFVLNIEYIDMFSEKFGKPRHKVSVTHELSGDFKVGDQPRY